MSPLQPEWTSAKYPAFSTHLLQITFPLILHTTGPDMHMSQIQVYYWKRPDRLWGLSNFRSNRYQDYLPIGKAVRTRNKPLLSRGVMQNAWNYTYLYSPCSLHGMTGTSGLSYQLPRFNGYHKYIRCKLLYKTFSDFHLTINLLVVNVVVFGTFVTRISTYKREVER